MAVAGRRAARPHILHELAKVVHIAIVHRELPEARDARGGVGAEGIRLHIARIALVIVMQFAASIGLFDNH